MRNKDTSGYYKILELSPDAEDKEIKEHYREQAKIWHPDYNKTGNAMEVFQKISVAHDILIDSQKRLTYDMACLAYGDSPLPDMFSLKIIRNTKGEEDINLRCIEYSEMIGLGLGYKLKEQKIYCSYAEAKRVLIKASVINWLLGWWSVKGFFKNFGVIKSNLKNIDKKQEENIKLLVHNALAYAQEKKYSQAAACAEQAKSYVTESDKVLLDRFIHSLPVSEKKILLKPWKPDKLKSIQLSVPVLIFLLIILLGIGQMIGKIRLDDRDKINYYQIVKTESGHNSVDDMIVSKVFDIPVDVYDTKMLYHIKQGYVAKILYGPSDKFDVLTYLGDEKTVRVTGLTPDKEWYRVMIDNGDMGFIKQEMLSKGKGSDIPQDSKIYKSQK